MLFPLHILADDGDTLGKVIFGLIALVIWGFSALVSWINKQQQEAKRRQIRDSIQPVERRMPPPSTARPIPPMQRSGPATVRLPSPPPVQSPRQIAEGLARRHPEVLQPESARRPRPLGTPLPPPARPRGMTQKPPKPKKRPAQRQPVHAPSANEQPIMELDEVPAPRLSTPPIVHSAAHAKPTAAPATAASIRRWLTPQTLRSQFILTELLQPPLALRESREL